MKVQELIDKLNLIEDKELDIEFLYTDTIQDSECYIEFDKLLINPTWVVFNLKGNIL